VVDQAGDRAGAHRRKQQQELRRFRQEYNQVRPHEALGMQTPAAGYRPSARSHRSRVPEPEYPATMLVRSVRGQGIFRWKKHDVFLTEVLRGEHVGLLPEDDRRFTIYFAQHPVARFDSQKLCVTPLPKTRSQATAVAGEGGSPPSPAVHPLPRKDSNVSAIRPV
jgi:Integrase core domain